LVAVTTETLLGVAIPLIAVLDAPLEEPDTTPALGGVDLLHACKQMETVRIIAAPSNF
jgi:hypothetical protein